jgi:phosphoribulokinase
MGPASASRFIVKLRALYVIGSTINHREVASAHFSFTWLTSRDAGNLEVTAFAMEGEQQRMLRRRGAGKSILLATVEVDFGMHKAGFNEQGKEEGGKQVRAYLHIVNGLSKYLVCPCTYMRKLRHEI